MKRNMWFACSALVLSLLLSTLWFGNKQGQLAEREKVPPTASVAVVITPQTDDLPMILKRKLLRALVPFGRSDFSILDNGQVQGLQVSLLQRYEDTLNKGIKREVDKVHIVWIPTSFDHLLPDLLAGKGDVAAALLTVTPERQKLVNFATGSGLEADELVVINSEQEEGIQRLEDLAGKEVHVLKGSSYEEHLQAINTQWVKQGLEPMVIKVADRRLLSEDLLKMVNAGMVGITVVDDYKGHLWAQLLPNIRVLDKVIVKHGNKLGWAVRKNNPLLLESLEKFSKSVKKGTLIGNMLFKRYLNSTWIQRPLAEDEKSKVKQVFPIFKKYAERYDYDVLAVIAQAYQESHLNHQRKSHRGAVGIMQLLPSTAAGSHVDIADISSLENHVHAGVKYLAFLRDRYFSNDDIHEVDRLAFTWAAYNAGPAKVIEMRALARKMGLNVNVWFGNVELAAAKLVGRETVHYVRSIFTHYIAYSLMMDSAKVATLPSHP